MKHGAALLFAALSYFTGVFGAGFVLGALRVTFVVPQLGVRYAELLEMPLMFGVILVASRLVVRRFQAGLSALAWLGAGLVALLLMLGAELLMAVMLADRSLREYLASRDPVSGSVYLALLLVFALAPWWRRRQLRPQSP